MTQKMAHCVEYAQLDRRTFLSRTMQAGASLVFGNRLAVLPHWMPRISLADPHVGPSGDTLICVFLRGGADGLNLVPPHGDDAYYERRPTIAVPRPDARSEQRALDVDGFFGLHPALSPLHPIFTAGDLLLVHATGSPDETRSHFEAMDLMERGAEGGEYTGWLARHLATLETGNESALRAIGIGERLQTSLTGALSASALQSIADYHFAGRDEQTGEMQHLLQTLYHQHDDLLMEAADRTFGALAVLSKIDTERYEAAGRPYPEHEFGRGMQTIAQLLKAGVGVEVACIDLGGWDTHVAQTGPFASQARLLAEGLAAFYEDLPDRREQTLVVVMSEFGRRLQENGGLGTDHGHGNMMIIMGGGVDGGRVFSQWPGLQPEQLVGPGDLAVTVDYRDILGEILRKRLNNPRVADVFPAYEVVERNLMQQNG